MCFFDWLNYGWRQVSILGLACGASKQLDGGNDCVVAKFEVEIRIVGPLSLAP